MPHSWGITLITSLYNARLFLVFKINRNVYLFLWRSVMRSSWWVVLWSCEDRSGAGLGCEDRSGAGLGYEDRSGAGLGCEDRSGAGLGCEDRSGAGLGCEDRSGAGLGYEDRSGAGLGCEDRSGAGLGYGSWVLRKWWRCEYRAIWIRYRWTTCGRCDSSEFALG